MVGFGIAFGFLACYLVIIALYPFKVETQQIELKERHGNDPTYRQDVSFMVDGVTLSGWLYLPQDLAKPVPCVVLNTGFCGTKDFLLEKYALRFVEAGFAAISFDYRHFGDSQGEPRQIYSVSKQLEDNKAVVAFARTRSEIDAEKIFLWGTSSSGNYGIMLAAEDKRIAGVIGQTPSLDHHAEGKMIVKREGMSWFLKLILHAQKDKLRSRFGLSSHTFPAVGKPGTTAMLIAPGFFEGYQKIAKNSKSFQNEVCARIMLAFDEPNLLKSAENVTCPVLFILCEDDNLTLPDAHKKIEKTLGELVKFIKYPIGHFEIYSGEYFEKCVVEQVSFITNIVEQNTI
ncbi:MAG: alpha/beta hydrolase [Deltaproteobacteria bacterium]|nr:alpha/beta hydrolase [Deltaproteobacteria bacterium]MBW2633970.1 alpha/beta hydrolase [Deltaproteobacteria bacterium]